MEFREAYRKLMSRLGVFRTSEEFEVQKTVASIDTLLRRADDLYRGAVPVYNEGLDIENVAQASCLAVSDDLYHFKKYENNPVYTPGPWADWDRSKWADCRDSFVLREGDVLYQYVFVSRRTADGKTEPATAVLSSADGICWKEEGTFKMPSCYHAAESPFVIRHGEQYLEIYELFWEEDGSIRIGEMVK